MKFLSSSRIPKKAVSAKWLAAKVLKVKFLHSTAGLLPCQKAVSHCFTRCVIGTPLIIGCSSDATKRGSTVKVGGEWGPLCQPSLFPLLCASALGLPVIDSSPIKSEERLTCDLKLSPSQPHPLPPSPFAC